MKKFMMFLTAILALFLMPFSASASFQGSQPVATVLISASSTNISTSTYSQLFSATALPVSTSQLNCYNSTGQTLKLGYGAAGLETAYSFQIPPGSGWYPSSLALPALTRIAVIAVGTAATTGVLLCNAMR